MPFGVTTKPLLRRSLVLSKLKESIGFVILPKHNCHDMSALLKLACEPAHIFWEKGKSKEGKRGWGVNSRLAGYAETNQLASCV